MSKLFSWLLLVSLLSARGLMAQEEEEEESLPTPEEETSVITLAQDNFTDYVQDKRIVLVEFYAPWCGHCKQLAPEYAAAAEMLKQHEIPLAQVDATANEELAGKYGVQGYPTMKVFHSGTPYDYEGPRQAQGIVDYMLDQARPDWKPPVDHVVVLTQENFQQTIDENPLVLAEFYAPWCGHCKRLAPEYTKAAGMLHNRGSDIVLAKIDATVETDLASQFEVTGYPTLKIFRRGKPSEYKGPRNAGGIAEYMFKQSLPPTLPLASTNDISALTKRPMPVVVGFFESEEDDRFIKYTDAANEGRESALVWLHCTASDIAEKYGIEFGTVAVFMPRKTYNKYEKKIKTYDGPFDISPEELLATLKHLATPLVGFRTGKTAKDFFANYPVLVGYISLEDEEDSFSYWRDKLLLPLAIKYRDIQFALSDDQEFAAEIHSLQLHDRGDDLRISILAQENEKYAYEDEDTGLDSVVEFIEAFKAGELKPILKSQVAPSKQTGPVKVVVGETFKQIVEDPNKDVLIEFYAPWCGHCKALEPIYNSLAKKFKKNDRLVIAKMDATANEFPDNYQVSGFPTIYFVPAGESPVPVLFEGEHKVKKMVKFLKKHAVFSLGDSSEKSNKTDKDEL